MPDDIGPKVQANRGKEAISLECPGGVDREQAVEQHNHYQQHGRDLAKRGPAVKEHQRGQVCHDEGQRRNHLDDPIGRCMPAAAQKQARDQLVQPRFNLLIDDRRAGLRLALKEAWLACNSRCRGMYKEACDGRPDQDGVDQS